LEMPMHEDEQVGWMERLGLLVLRGDAVLRQR